MSCGSSKLEFNSVKNQCVVLERALRKLLRNPDDTESRSVINSLFRSDIWFQSKRFRSSHSIPLLRAIGAIEQVWGEIDRCEYRKNFKSTLRYALDILTGKRVLVTCDPHPSLMGIRSSSKRKQEPEWYTKLLELVDQINSSSWLDKQTVISLLETTSASDPSTVAGYLAERLVHALLAGHPVSPWDILKWQWGNEDFIAEIDMITSGWDAGNVKWDEVRHLKMMLKAEVAFGVHYVCHGWHHISFTIVE